MMSNWNELLLCLDERQTLIPPLRHYDQVTLERTWRTHRDNGESRKNACAVWKKQYNINAESIYLSLDASKNWEALLLQEIAMHDPKLQYCCAPYDLNLRFSALNTILIQTLHSGVSLDYWERMRPYAIDGSLRNTPFFSPAAFLKLAYGLLQAFKEFHEARFVHADFREDNVCMSLSHPVSASGQPEDVWIFPDWNNIKLIDFGFSVNRDHTPTAMPPHRHRDKSGHFDVVMKYLEQFILREGGNISDSVNSEWWGKNNRKDTLRLVTLLDWREDIQACGKMLDRIRKQVDFDLSKSAEMIGLVNSLPEEMIEKSEAGPTPVELFTGSGKSKDIPEQPHQEWMEKIHSALSTASSFEIKMVESFRLRKEDHDRNKPASPSPRPPSTMLSIPRPIQLLPDTLLPIHTTKKNAQKSKPIKAFVRVVIALTSIAFLVWWFTQPVLILSCPSHSNSAGMAAFKASASEVWKRKQDHDPKAETLWQQVSTELVGILGREIPSGNGWQDKAGALLCLKAMAKSGNIDPNAFTRGFDELNKSMDEPNLSWIDGKLVIGKNTTKPVSFDLWRENIYAKAAAGDDQAQADKTDLEQYKSKIDAE